MHICTLQCNKCIVSHSFVFVSTGFYCAQIRNVHVPYGSPLVLAAVPQLILASAAKLIQFASLNVITLFYLAWGWPCLEILFIECFCKTCRDS